MKILFIAPRFHSNQYELIQKLIEEGCAVDFFVMGEGNSEDYSFVKPTLIPISFFTKLYLYIVKKQQKIDVFKYASLALPSFFSYYNLIKQAKADIIIVRVGNYPYFLLLIPFIFWNRNKFVFYSQQPKYQNVQTSWKKRIFNKIISLNHKIPWYTPVLYYGSHKDFTINNKYLTYIPFFSKSKIELKLLEFKEDKVIRFLCVSKYEKRKGIKELIKATNVLATKGYKFKVTIIGSTGSQAREEFYLKLQEQIVQLELKNIIELKKNIPYSKMSEEYKKNQVFILPTTKEPASVSQLEAMSYGLAIICSNDNGTAHYIKNGDNGFLITPDSCNIVKAMETYLINPSLLFKHQKQSLRNVNNELSIENSFQKLMSLIKR